jgi:hypothetical protein
MGMNAAPEAPPAPCPPAAPEPQQRVIKVRRDYNSWVASETMEDYALRFTPRASASGANGGWPTPPSAPPRFLVLEAVGATLLVQYGFVNARWAILATGLIIFLAGCRSASTPRATASTWTC